MFNPIFLMIRQVLVMKSEARIAYKDAVVAYVYNEIMKCLIYGSFSLALILHAGYAKDVEISSVFCR